MRSLSLAQVEEDGQMKLKVNKYRHSAMEEAERRKWDLEDDGDDHERSSKPSMIGFPRSFGYI